MLAKRYGSVETAESRRCWSPLYCYTQLTDVEQEINELLTYDRQPQVPFEKIKQGSKPKSDAAVTRPSCVVPFFIIGEAVKRGMTTAHLLLKIGQYSK